MAKVFQIASGKGGTGKTTTTVLLALSLAKLGKKVLAIDCDIGFQALSRMFSVSEKILFNWGDVILGNANPKDALVPAGNGIDVIGAPLSDSNAFTSESFQKTLELYKQKYDIILLDSPAGLMGMFKVAGKVADATILVSTPDIISASASASAADILHSMEKDNVYLLINQFSARAVRWNRALNLDTMIDTVGAQLIGVLPYRKEVRERTANIHSFMNIRLLNDGAERVASRLFGKRVPLESLDKM